MNGHRAKKHNVMRSHCSESFSPNKAFPLWTYFTLEWAYAWFLWITLGERQERERWPFLLHKPASLTCFICKSHHITFRATLSPWLVVCVTFSLSDWGLETFSCKILIILHKSCVITQQNWHYSITLLRLLGYRWKKGFMTEWWNRV